MSAISLYKISQRATGVAKPLLHYPIEQWCIKNTSKSFVVSCVSFCTDSSSNFATMADRDSASNQLLNFKKTQVSLNKKPLPLV